MGLSGSGKSTLLRAVNGLNPVVRGSVSVNASGSAYDSPTVTQDQLLQLRSEEVAMVFQRFGLMPWRNVLDNEALGLELGGMSRAEREEFKHVGLPERADNKVSELSGGMQQRCGASMRRCYQSPDSFDG